MTETSYTHRVEIEDVRSFWDANPCGSARAKDVDRTEYFANIERDRYRREWHIPLVAGFERFDGRRVLEVGCGIGTDGVQFARAGAEYVGVDLSPASLELAREQFELLGLDSTLEVANAEHLPFPDAQFDHVYSFGVIHHSPDVPAIVDEIQRVLKPRGTVTVMVYNRSSINYRLEISVLRRAFRRLLRAERAPGLLSRIGFDRNKLERHRELLVSRPDLSEEEWVSINTDGPDCPLSRVYDEREAASLFTTFSDVRQSVWYFDRDHWPVVGGVVPDALAGSLGRRWGWHRVVDAVKPA